MFAASGRMSTWLGIPICVVGGGTWRAGANRLGDCFIKNPPWWNQGSVVYSSVTPKAAQWRVNLRTGKVYLVEVGDFPVMLPQSLPGDRNVKR